MKKPNRDLYVVSCIIFLALGLPQGALSETKADPKHAGATPLKTTTKQSSTKTAAKSQSTTSVPRGFKSYQSAKNFEYQRSYGNDSQSVGGLQKLNVKWYTPAEPARKKSGN